MPDGRKVRRHRLLQRLAKAAGSRHDVKLDLARLAPDLDIAHFHGGTKFVDKDAPVYEGGSDLAYDYSTLLEEGLIRTTHLRFERDKMGYEMPHEPAVQVTPEGLALVADLQKSWLRKGIEKEPMTFAGVVVTLVLSIVSAVGGWLVRRQTATSPDCPPQTVATPPAGE